MKPFVIIFCILAALFLITLPFELSRRRRMQSYWGRVCTGFQWRRRFPTASSVEVREFLDLFVDAFAFSRKKRLCFSPDDRIMDVYRAIYPPGSLSDSLELETLAITLEKRYGIDVSKSGSKDITLGEIYEQTHRVA